MSETAMELKQLKKKIGSKEIIKGLDFEIQKGEVFGFIGPNGAGKTTTIRMMVGLMGITEGEVVIQGQSVKSNFKKAIQEVGAIVENPEMYPFMTGMQNLKHFARMTPGITRERIDEVVGLVGMENAIKTKVGRYSLGMRQRLGIAQALLHKPSILILDEPTNGLDPAGIRHIRKYIRRLASEENVAVIISSHLLTEIELMCDRIGIIKNGEMIGFESVNEQDADDDGSRQIAIEAEPSDKAAELLKERHGIDVEMKEGFVAFEASKTFVPQIVTTLVNEEVLVYRVEVSKASVEDKFFDMIGENVIG
ncbi:ABC transporter ATP-binding protein [Salinicoccus albus]|uniref:ABC transporter ATP-binding protein n=1 Tax=Salinicoccus albus TaxID=418756 RepID=UPI00047840B0|nr:ABC transporter ATP-binding protein [Salinicoccus albus]